MKPDSLSEPGTSSHRRWRHWLALSLLVLLADQASKQWILANLNLGQHVAVTPFFNLVLVYNPGAAFSLLADQGGWQRWLLTGLGLGASLWMTWMLRQQHQQRAMAAALALIIGGALGNVWDRLVYGQVIDFIDVHGAVFQPVFSHGHFPAFNIADTAISIGALLLIADEIRRSRGARKHHSN